MNVSYIMKTSQIISLGITQSAAISNIDFLEESKMIIVPVTEHRNIRDDCTSSLRTNLITLLIQVSYPSLKQLPERCCSALMCCLLSLSELLSRVPIEGTRREIGRVSARLSMVMSRGRGQSRGPHTRKVLKCGSCYFWRQIGP